MERKNSRVDSRKNIIIFAVLFIAALSVYILLLSNHFIVSYYNEVSDWVNLSLARLLIGDKAVEDNVLKFAKDIINIEAEERLIDAEYWRGRISLRKQIRGIQKRYEGKKDIPSTMDDTNHLYSYVEINKISKLKNINKEFKKIRPPPGCRQIMSKLITSKDRRLATLSASVNYSKGLPLAGMNDSEYKETFGDWCNNGLKLESEYHRNYKEAWTELSGKLQPGFIYPPFEMLDYEFMIYEANIKGWLASRSYPEDRGKYQTWSYYVENVTPPKVCIDIHKRFIASGEIKMKSFEPGLSPGEISELEWQASSLSEEAWSGLLERILSYYNSVPKRS